MNTEKGPKKRRGVLMHFRLRSPDKLPACSDWQDLKLKQVTEQFDVG
jgi:hypothetical protein